MVPGPREEGVPGMMCCTLIEWADDADGVVCGRIAIGSITTICHHEHMGTDWFCADHAARWVPDLLAGQMICVHCDRGDLVHDCPLAVVARTGAFAAEVTR